MAVYTPFRTKPIERDSGDFSETRNSLSKFDNFDRKTHHLPERRAQMEKWTVTYNWLALNLVGQEC
uniref:AlNc14C364G11029 protein n=1 Tax=Albugo laibachii Nc14 TaxID=890382 RepID=F0WXU2_9STRA|nr:AlNc14C364G11029 [Albugo laibachii Nc14]|eukprot:CCA26290.1 AlNc14C364G11029 [Albugo laibachii Nc14]